MKKQLCTIAMAISCSALLAQNWQEIDGTNPGNSGLFLEYTTSSPLPNVNVQGSPNITYGFCLELEENSNALFAGGYFNHIFYGGNETVSTNIARLNAGSWQSNFGFQHPQGNQASFFSDFPQTIMLSDIEQFNIPGTTTRTTWATGFPISFFNVGSLPGTIANANIPLTFFNSITGKWQAPSGISSGSSWAVQEYMGELYVSGQFILPGQPGVHSLIKIAQNGAVTPINVVGEYVWVLEVVEINGVEKLFAGGRFTAIDNAVSTNIAVLEPALLGGLTWSPVGLAPGIGNTPGLPAAVYSIDKYQANGVDVLCAGTEPINALGLPTDDGCVSVLAPLICIRGLVTSDINEVAAGGVWELPLGATLWDNTVKTNGPVYALEGEGNRLHAGGLFNVVTTSANPANLTTARNFFSWNGNNLSNLTNGFSNTVFDLEGWNNELYAIGMFDDIVNGSGPIANVNKIAKLDLGAGTNFHTQKSNLIEQTNQNTFNLKMYPSPSRKDLNISFNLTKNQEILIDITNLTGQSVLKQNYYLIEGNQKITIDLASLNIESGNYIVRVQHPDFIKQQQIHFIK